jgi:ABC-type phosphate transport system ATPase subunit
MAATGLSTSIEARRRGAPSDLAPVVFDLGGLDVSYGSHRAVRDVSMSVREREITALIGPSGCGKSTVRLNRMNDLVPGKVAYRGQDLYGQDVDPAEARRRIGMAFQKAARVSDRTAFFTADTDSEGERYGFLVEYDTTEKLCSRPADQRTEDYISGRFG